MANEGKNATYIRWTEQNVVGTTDPDDSTPIRLMFEDEENVYVMKLSRGNARWLRKALKDAVRFSELGKD